MKQGYGFEREIELWAINTLGQDKNVDFAKRSYRTATSGARGDGDVRMQSDKLPFRFIIECKHRKYSYGGEYAFRLDAQVIRHVLEEAERCKLPTQDRAVAAVTFAFKGARRNRIWFAFTPECWDVFNSNAVEVARWEKFIHKKTGGSDYLIVRRSALETDDGILPVANFPGIGSIIFAPISEVEECIRAIISAKA